MDAEEHQYHDDHVERTPCCACPPCVPPALFAICSLAGGIVLGILCILPLDKAPMLQLSASGSLSGLAGQIIVGLWKVCYMPAAGGSTCTQAIGVKLDGLSLPGAADDIQAILKSVIPAWTTLGFFAHPLAAALALASQLVWLIGFLGEESDSWYFTMCFSNRNRNLPALWLAVAAFIFSLALAICDCAFFALTISNAHTQSISGRLGSLFAFLCATAVGLLWLGFVGAMMHHCTDPPENVDAFEWKDAGSIAVQNPEAREDHWVK